MSCTEKLRTTASGSVDMAYHEKVTVTFRAETDLADWNARYERGLVPDKYPYGLHKLASSGVETAWASVPALSAARKAALVARPPRRRHDGPWAIAWDEYSALRMFAAIPGARYATGVIWTSDEIGRGYSRRARAASMARSLGAADLVWVLSTAQIPVLHRMWGHRAPRIEFVPFGIAADFFTPSRHPGRTSVRPSVLSLGNDRDRDLPTTLRALEIVHRERPEVRLRVQSKNRTPLPDGVERVPFLSHADLRELYRDTTVVAVATRPNLHVSGMTSALEAMASSCALVMTRSPGVDDYVGIDSGGLLVPQADPAELARGILAALDPGVAPELGASGRIAVQSRFTTDMLAARLAELLL
ncbi:MAG: glycosyltransferase family 4 protein [Microbacteriaceae bacterium]